MKRYLVSSPGNHARIRRHIFDTFQEAEAECLRAAQESGCWFRMYYGADGYCTAAGNGFTVATVDPYEEEEPRPGG